MSIPNEENIQIIHTVIIIIISYIDKLRSFLESSESVLVHDYYFIFTILNNMKTINGGINIAREINLVFIHSKTFRQKNILPKLRCLRLSIILIASSYSIIFYARFSYNFLIQNLLILFKMHVNHLLYF